jgi:hypothetical protein
VRANYFKHRKIHLRAKNANQPETHAETAGESETPVEEQEPEEEEEEDEERSCQEEGDPGPVEEVVAHHHNLVPAVVAGPAAGDFFQFASEQQWIT